MNPTILINLDWIGKKRRLWTEGMCVMVGSGKQGWDIRVIWFLKIRSCSQRCCGYWVCVGLRFVEIGTNLTESNKTNDYQFVTFSLLCSHPISNEKKEVKRPTRNKMDNCLKNFIYRWQFFGWPIIKSRKKILIITSLSWQLTWPLI